MTRDGSLESINLDNITHLVISSAIVDEFLGASSYVDTTFTTLNIPSLSKLRTTKACMFFLTLPGNSMYMNGGGLYGNYGFYNVVKDAEKRSKAIDTFLKFAVDNDFDGVNIYLNNASEDTGIIKPEFTTPFYEEIAAKLPEGPNGRIFLYGIGARRMAYKRIQSSSESKRLIG